jgi:hypothetical protein
MHNELQCVGESVYPLEARVSDKGQTPCLTKVIVSFFTYLDFFLQNQWGRNGGRCGVCGDPYQQKPRENEAGGKYATGIISKCYPYNSSGQTVNVKVELTVNHRGYFEFRLCEHNDTSTPITQSCLDENLLRFPDNTTRYNVREDVHGVINLQLQIPPTVRCTQCVLQWKYNTGKTGNTWDPVLYLTEIKKLCALRALRHLNIETKIYFTLPDNTTVANNLERKPPCPIDRHICGFSLLSIKIFHFCRAIE